MPFSSRMSAAPASSPRLRSWRRAVGFGLAALWITTACWETNKPLPPGMSIESPPYAVPATDVSFIADITAADAYGRRISSQAIFDEVLRVVRSAREFLVLDYFLFDSEPIQLGTTPSRLRPIAAELRDALIEQRRTVPGLKVLFITDPVNQLYGPSPSDELRLLSGAGVDVVVTDLDRLRDPNFVYSSLWRLTAGWWSTGSSAPGWLPDPRDEGTSTVTFGTWTRLLNFKANQRKVVIGDDGRGALVGVVASANPHDASSAQSNVAAKVSGPGLRFLLESELAVARFSGWNGEIPLARAQSANPETLASTDPDIASGQSARVQFLTEGAIRGAILEHIDAATKGESVDIAMFYLADRGVVESLLAAGRRGVNVRVMLDPNRDAFGHTRSGLPNQPVATELVAASDGAIHVRWYRTHGEQFHTKLIMVYGRERLWLTLGSADLTRRALDDYNLEANVAIEVARSSQLALQTLDYFEALWSNRASVGIEYTADFANDADPSQAHYWLYRFLEGTGMADF